MPGDFAPGTATLATGYKLNTYNTRSAAIAMH